MAFRVVEQVRECSDCISCEHDAKTRLLELDKTTVHRRRDANMLGHRCANQSFIFAELLVRMLNLVVAAENVHIPDELQTPKGLRRLTDELRAFFCDETNRRLYCLKVGCCRPNNHNQNYINMLGWLTTFRDCEVVGYQWQRQRDKTHSADYVLQQASAAKSK